MYVSHYRQRSFRHPVFILTPFWLQRDLAKLVDRYVKTAMKSTKAKLDQITTAQRMVPLSLQILETSARLKCASTPRSALPQ